MSDLVRVAILGTGQTRGSVKSGTDADPLIDRLALGTEAGEGAREREVLLRAGAAAVLRRAGTRAVPWTTPLTPAAEEISLRARPTLAALLASLLDGEDKELLAEALEAMARKGLRLPEELLPKALDEHDSGLRTRLLPVLGERGRWLAAQGLDETWSWARATPDAESSDVATLPANAEAAWVEGTTLERELLLSFARRLEPDRGRAWVESSFKTDKPEQRRRWLELLELGLSMADVPFLESALGDRSAVVKIRAARALWRLPETRMGKAVQERVDALIGPDLRIELPAEPFDSALEKLGIVEAPPQGAGKRQFWLAQLVSAVPPGHFERRSNMAAEELVEAAAKHDLREVLLDGWTSAALRFEARGWFAPLWDAWSRDDTPKSWSTPRPLAALTQRMTASDLRAELEPRLLRSVREGRHLDLLAALARPWPDAIADACLVQVRARTRAFVWSLPLVATRIPIALARADLDFGAAQEGRRDHFEDGLEKFRALLDLRRHIDAEIEAHPASTSFDPERPPKET